MFAQLDVRLDTQSTIIDLVADPTPIAEVAQPMIIGDATILVETPHQLLINKLCALLSRSEVRDLIDIRALVESGADLPRALNDRPGQDAGFSPMTFAWGAQSLPLRRIAAAQGWPEPEIRVPTPWAAQAQGPATSPDANHAANAAAPAVAPAQPPADSTTAFTLSWAQSVLGTASPLQVKVELASCAVSTAASIVVPSCSKLHAGRFVRIAAGALLVSRRVW